MIFRYVYYLFSFLEYKHPTTGAPITTVRLVIPSEVVIRRTQTKRQKSGYDYISIFISFTYVNRTDEKKKELMKNKQYQKRHTQENEHEDHSLDL